jgi:coatomer subunit beta'
MWRLRLPSDPLCCREGSTQVKIFKNFKEVAQVRPGFSIEAIYGGALLGIAGADFIAFYDWTTATVRIIIMATCMLFKDSRSQLGHPAAAALRA